MSQELLVRDVMRIGVPTCKEVDPVPTVAALMLDQNATALIVLDDDGDTAGWINEACLVDVYRRSSIVGDAGTMTAGQIMYEQVPEFPAVDVPLSAAVQYMAGEGVDHLFFLHHAGGRAWPASVLSWRDVVRVLAGPEYLRGQGAGAPRPTPMDLFRQRYGK